MELDDLPKEVLKKLIFEETLKYIDENIIQQKEE